MNWYKIAIKEDRKQYFLDKTNNHINLVQKASEKIVKKFPEFLDLIKQVKKHDASKFKEPELTPYISLNWRKKTEDSKYHVKDLISKDEENEATIHHITSNSHHPEYHLENKEDANIDSSDRDKSVKCVDASLMPDIDIAEMVADWEATAEELKTNTSREWFDEQKDVRWHFSKKQENLIDKLLKTFE